MNTSKIKIQSVDPALIQENRVLTLSVDRQEVERTAHFIREYGLLMPPVVGLLENGGSKLVSGEREFMALRQLGVARAETVVVAVGSQEEMDKLSLLISTLRQAPNPLSEGVLLEQIMQTGHYTQTQLAEMLAKSVSWVNKRLSLASRLALPVRDLVSQGLLCAHSAQSIAKLPEEEQAGFARNIIQEGLPKSAVEVLVSAYRRPECTQAMRANILKQPRHALGMIQAGRALADKNSESHRKYSPRSLYNNLALLMACLGEAEKDLVLADLGRDEQTLRLIHMSKKRCHMFIRLVDNQLGFSPGKEDGGGDDE